MALSREQVLSDADSLVAELVTELSSEGLTYEQNKIAVEDAKKIFNLAAEIMGRMLEAQTKPTVH